ncbi:unnamed protein product, partial [Mesorhabditis belari]|uniref:Uncharacterized protein n=1 Tax=Mesorhabditis belari TaxID=2138241 RepID=A0AAF3E8U1_9BILA
MLLKGVLFFALCALFQIGSAAIREAQSVRVQGSLTCEGRPYPGAKVKLYDHDTFTLDDKMAETETDSRGYFDISGTENELTRLNAKFNIYHRCRKTVPICYYKASFAIPYDYVTSGQQASKIFDAGTIELSILKKDRDCIN